MLESTIVVYPYSIELSCPPGSEFNDTDDFTDVKFLFRQLKLMSDGLSPFLADKGGRWDIDMQDAIALLLPCYLYEADSFLLQCKDETEVNRDLYNKIVAARRIWRSTLRETGLVDNTRIRDVVGPVREAARNVVKTVFSDTKSVKTLFESVFKSVKKMVDTLESQPELSEFHDEQYNMLGEMCAALPTLVFQYWRCWNEFDITNEEDREVEETMRLNIDEALRQIISLSGRINKALEDFKAIDKSLITTETNNLCSVGRQMQDFVFLQRFLKKNPHLWNKIDEIAKTLGGREKVLEILFEIRPWCS